MSEVVSCVFGQAKAASSDALPSSLEVGEGPDGLAQHEIQIRESERSENSNCNRSDAAKAVNGRTGTVDVGW